MQTPNLLSQGASPTTSVNQPIEIIHTVCEHNLVMEAVVHIECYLPLRGIA